MSTYALNDFSESLSRVRLPSLPVFVVRAWGESSEGPGCEWSGGFVLRLADGQFAYVSGWCDYTGWGCKDGAHVTVGPTIEGLDIKSSDHRQPKSKDSWDDEPVDLNRWIVAGMPEEAEMWNDIGVKRATAEDRNA